jgi:hypothetical protein
VSDQLGHASTKTTWDIYVHLFRARSTPRQPGAVLTPLSVLCSVRQVTMAPTIDQPTSRVRVKARNKHLRQTTIEYDRFSGPPAPICRSDAQRRTVIIPSGHLTSRKSAVRARHRPSSQKACKKARYASDWIIMENSLIVA